MSVRSTCAQYLRSSFVVCYVAVRHRGMPRGMQADASTSMPRGDVNSEACLGCRDAVCVSRFAVAFSCLSSLNVRALSI